MSLEISSISVEEAAAFLVARQCALPDKYSPLFAIAVADSVTRGVILMGVDGGHCALIQVYGDGSPQAQTLLYGAAWRAAKALGYKLVRI